MTFNKLSISISDGIATVLLDDPDAAVNTVSPAWLIEMTAAFEQLRDDETVSGIIIASAKTGFLAGVDLKFVLAHAAGMTAAEAFAFSQQATRMHRLIETCGKPVVAAMTGFALGGGYELALACTYRILADDPKAVVGLPEVKFGLLPGSGGTQRLPRLIGVAKAADALLEGRSFAPAKALALGMVDRVVPADEVQEAARAWLATNPDSVRPWDRKGFSIPESDGLLKQTTAGFFSAMGGKLLARYGSNYPAPISILTCLFEGVQAPFDHALAVESRHFARLLTDPVARNIVRTTFLSKQAAERGARRPANVPTFRISKVGVLGAGMMGAGIAYVCARAGIDVVLLDQSHAAAEKGKAYSTKILSKLAERGEIDQAKADALLSRIVPTDEYALLAGADLIIEAVFEDTAIKADVTRKAEAVIPDHAIFASNTSTLPISGLATASKRPGQFIGLHFFSPVDRMGLVEIIMGKQTTPETLAASLDFIARIRKTPIVVNDSRGFYTSRVFQTLIHEGCAMLAEGIPPAAIENAARAVGLPVGPLALLDEVTFDLPLKIIDQAIAEDGDAYVIPAGNATLRTMKAQGRSGRSTGGGFYDYPPDGRKRLWAGLADLFPVRTGWDIETVKQRLLYIQALETARCVEEGVIETPEDGDLGAVYGWAFPTWTGGTLSYIDTVGIATFVREADRLAQRHGGRFTPSAWLRDKAARAEPFYAAQPAIERQTEAA